MIGTPAVAAFLAWWGFWILLALGWWRGELALRGIAICLFLWLAGFVGLRYVRDGGFFFPPYVAVLDVALVFAVFKGDVKLT